MVKVIYGFFLFCSFLWQGTYAQSLQFFGEKIEVTIHEKYAEVNGNYHLRNNSLQPIRRTLFYPFTINQNLPYPDSISVTLNKASIPFQRKNDGIIFSMEIAPDSIEVYEVYYSQKTPANEMEYILTSTQRWQKPLRFAEYIIKLPQQLLLKYLSLNPSEMAVDGEYEIYRVFRNDYMPKTNLIVEWTRRK